MGTTCASPAPAAVRFSHIHIYADTVRPLVEYKELEERATRLSHALAEVPAATQNGGVDIGRGKAAWASIAGTDANHAADFKPQGQDVVEQLIMGAGWRITSAYESHRPSPETAGTRSVCLSTSARNGAHVIVTCCLPTGVGGQSFPNGSASKGGVSTGDGVQCFHHFAASAVQRFYGCHAQRQGIAVLSFEVHPGDANRILERYRVMHPKLLPYSDALHDYDGTRVLDVYAYYLGEVRVSDADKGTVLRFIERPRPGQIDDGELPAAVVLPGLQPTAFSYGHASLDFPAFCDHWVSNVTSREGFLQTLEDGLGFVPQVEFNAGVVAAGEARIESTVTGNMSSFRTTDKAAALRDQSQVFLPINNALSDKGHVHTFLQELGQGIQHVASRVNDLCAFVQSVNDRRTITGTGFSFLRIPRSYYGTLTAADLVAEGGVATLGEAREIMAALEAAGVCDGTGIVPLDATPESILAACKAAPCLCLAGAPPAEAVSAAVLKSRYANLYKLLRDQIGESEYMRIVRNQVLVDVQGDDLLYQIFTSNILQKHAGEQAPFFEFIQRVCSQKPCANGSCRPLKPGCGGFGIRNFLTLFLSIEVSKAMDDVTGARSAGDASAMRSAQRRVELFTEQLNESNPILTVRMQSSALSALGRDCLCLLASACLPLLVAPITHNSPLTTHHCPLPTAHSPLSTHPCLWRRSARLLLLSHPLWWEARTTPHTRLVYPLCEGHASPTRPLTTRLDLT